MRRILVPATSSEVAQAFYWRRSLLTPFISLTFFSHYSIFFFHISLFIYSCERIYIQEFSNWYDLNVVLLATMARAHVDNAVVIRPSLPAAFWFNVRSLDELFRTICFFRHTVSILHRHHSQTRANMRRRRKWTRAIHEPRMQERNDVSEYETIAMDFNRLFHGRAQFQFHRCGAQMKKK